MSYARLLRVPYFYAILLAAVNLAIVGYVQPRARYAYEGLRFELRSGALGASIKVGEFTRLGDKLTLRIERSRNSGAELSGIFVHATPTPGNWASATAERGQFLRTDDPDVIIFRLTNGTLVHNAPGYVAPRVLSFTSHDLPIDLPRFEAFRRRGERNLELTLPELAVLGHDARVTEEMRDTSRAAFHFRLAEVATMFLLPIVMIVAYHKVNEYGEDIGGLGRVDPIIALWGPFAVFAALTFWMYYTIAYVPGGQPIGALERVAGKTWGWIRRRFAFGRRQEAAA
jgi:lipopolysaccharide export system permease protein